MSLKWGWRCFGSYFLMHSNRQLRADTLDSARSELRKIKMSLKSVIMIVKQYHSKNLSFSMKRGMAKGAKSALCERHALSREERSLLVMLWLEF